MNITTALKRIDKLDQKQLKQALQMAEDNISRYQYVIRNYTPELMESHGTPHLTKLENIRNRFLLQSIFGKNKDAT